MRTIPSKKKPDKNKTPTSPVNELTPIIKEIRDIIDKGLENKVNPEEIINKVTKALISPMEKGLSDINKELSGISGTIKNIKLPKQVTEADFDIRRDVNDKMIGFKMKVKR